MLTEQQLEDILSLQHICESTERLTLKLNWDMLRTRQAHVKSDYYHYKGETLIGFLGVYKFGSKLEICGMVHPDYRRKGIFTFLLKEALQDSVITGFSSLLLNSPAASISGTQFLHGIPCRYESSEYQMKWISTQGRATLSIDEHIQCKQIMIRRAIHNDMDTIIRLDKDGFGMSDQDVLDMYQEITSDGLQNMYMIEYDGKSVGKINVLHLETETWIYAFTVEQAQRGQGIGQSTLHLIIEQEQSSEKELWIEVAVDNPIALKLYESCGFATQTKQDYYQYTG
ncbi:GNAT family N-acetyltransferase [Paenibacillus sp. CMAA1364]